MKDSKALFADIESETFRQEAQILNNLATLTQGIIRANKNVNEFYEYYSSYPDEGATVLSGRIRKLLSLVNNERYLHKYDAAIATYLYMLNTLSRSRSQQLMSEIELPKNTWWALQMLVVLQKKENTKKTVYRYNSINLSDASNHIDANLDSHNSATANIKGVFA